MNALRPLALLSFLVLALFGMTPALAQLDSDEPADSLSGQPSLTLAPEIGRAHV